MYIPLLFAAVFALDKFLRLESGGRTASLLVVTLATTLSLWLALQGVLNVREIIKNNSEDRVNPSSAPPSMHMSAKTLCLPALIVLVALLGAAHILVRTSTYGAALGNDAFNYLSAAESLAAGEGLLRTPNPLNASVAKWLDNHAAAISITNDDWPVPGREPDIDGYVLEHGLVMGYEVVTGNSFYGDRIFSGPEDERIVYLMSELVPKGFGYFGHGHNHIDHDELSYEEALESFQANYETMKDWGMKPVAYAYPRSAGNQVETQLALEASGFLSGRLPITSPSATQNPLVRIVRYFRRLAQGTTSSRALYNLPGSQLAPDNWFGLRALEMQSIEFQGCDDCINDNDELVPILDEALEQTAWVILTYHSIGKPEHWGWYDWDEFRKDVRSIAARDFWTAPMNDITLYVRERENAVITVDVVEGGAGIENIEITLSDGLDNVRFDQPLTILFDQPKDWVGRPFTVSQDGKLLDELVFDTEAVTLSLKPNERSYLLRPRYSGSAAIHK